MSMASAILITGPRFTTSPGHPLPLGQTQRKYRGPSQAVQ
ncbi:unnamed protein product [Discosporangium mesarthrocarpum]